MPTSCRALFVHTLVPIALAYVVAHYFSLLAYQGQATAYLASDPFGNGIGPVRHRVEEHRLRDHRRDRRSGTCRSARSCSGHACALILAHDRALALYRSSHAAAVSQYWMLAVMVGFTSLGCGYSGRGNQ